MNDDVEVKTRLAAMLAKWQLKMIDDVEVKSKLFAIYEIMSTQTELAMYYGGKSLSFAEEMEQIREFIDVDEYSVAYEVIVSNLEQVPFILPSKIAISLLELGLIMGYKP